MLGLTKCRPLLIVLGARRKEISLALMDVAPSLQPVTAALQSLEEEEKEEEKARVEKVPFSLLAGGRSRNDDRRGLLRAGKRGCAGRSRLSGEEGKDKKTRSGAWRHEH